ncbi:MAG TPA: ATP-binding protein [Candidatus Synoicihabitans sp.]|nr:ATP-binding protein [Candidatus Synoicihabitans sp.]
MIRLPVAPVFSAFLPHGFCYRWDATLVWLHVISDALIALAYFSIPASLVYFVRRRKDVAFGWMFACFALFILSCGATHVMGIWTVWEPAYWWSGWVKALTALASVPTAYLLATRVVPIALRLPSPEALRRVNEDLRREVSVRVAAEAELSRKADALAQSNRDLQQFAYVASHDLREPLRMVSSYCQLLREEAGDRVGPAAARYIDYAVKGASRMQSLVEAMLTYSLLSSQELALREVDLEETVQEALESLGLAIAEAGATVTHDPMPVIRGDSSQLGQLLQNLIANAIKFRGPSPSQVHIGARPEGDMQVLFVRDNGIGISPEFFDKIFLMFQRLHAPNTYAGTGIGLAVCQRIVERHHGRIWVESEPGRGATFFVALPL